MRKSKWKLPVCIQFSIGDQYRHHAVNDALARLSSSSLAEDHYLAFSLIVSFLLADHHPLDLSSEACHVHNPCRESHVLKRSHDLQNVDCNTFRQIQNGYYTYTSYSLNTSIFLLQHLSFVAELQLLMSTAELLE